jgi:hypothetical protein
VKDIIGDEWEKSRMCFEKVSAHFGIDMSGIWRLVDRIAAASNGERGSRRIYTFEGGPEDWMI